MVDIPLPVSTSPGIKSQESGGRLINVYAEPLGEGSPAQVARRRAPGLKSFGTTSRTGCRGMIDSQGTLYAVFSSGVDTLTSAGGASIAIGTLPGTKKGFLAKNNNTTADIVFVDPDGNIATLASGSVTVGYPDTDLPAVNSVTSIDGYLVFTTGDGRAFASDLNSTSVNALSFGKAEARPDGLVRAVGLPDRLLLFGSLTTEIWTNAGTTPFPFSRSTVIPRGLTGPYAVAGYEDGFNKGVFFVADDNGVYNLDGFTPDKISPPDLDGLIEAVTDKTELEMCCYVSRGHSFIQLSSSNWTWVYNVNNRKWHERTSHLGVRSRISVSYFAFSKWLCGDTLSGNVNQIDGSTYKELTNPFRVRIESGPVTKFPGGEVVGRADFYFTTGVGNASSFDANEVDPSVEISWSDNGGLRWSNPIIRSLGRQSESEAIVSLVACTGRSTWMGRRWRVDISDPVYASLMRATQSADPRVPS